MYLIDGQGLGYIDDSNADMRSGELKVFGNKLQEKWVIFEDGEEDVRRKRNSSPEQMHILRYTCQFYAILPRTLFISFAAHLR